jgi:hypothetical protein
MRSNFRQLKEADYDNGKYGMVIALSLIIIQLCVMISYS